MFDIEVSITRREVLKSVSMYRYLNDGKIIRFYFLDGSYRDFPREHEEDFSFKLMDEGEG